MSKAQRLALTAGGAVLLIAILLLALPDRRQCKDPSGEKCFQRAVKLLSRDQEKKQRMGLDLATLAAEKGFPAALAFMGEVYLQELPLKYRPEFPAILSTARNLVEADSQQALFFFNKLEGQPNLKGGQFYNLGVLSESPELDQPKKAKSYYQTAAALGDAAAMYVAGIEEEGKKQFKTAQEWFAGAFEAGEHPGAALKLGDYALHGRGQTVDAALATDWYRKTVAAAKSWQPEAWGNQFSKVAKNRLIVTKSMLKSHPSGEIEFNYQLKGKPNSYRLYLPGPPAILIGKVTRTEEGICAQLIGAPDTSAANESLTVATMHEGMVWVLDSVARHLYGQEKAYRFVLQKN